jgi:hypothetical protein
MKTITLATFDTPSQAEPLRLRLMESHIGARIRGGGALKQLWFVDRPKAGIKLDVEAKDFEKSLKLMRKVQAEKAVTRHIVRCPECHSSRVEYPQFTRKFFLPNVVGLLSGLGLVAKKYYCEDCHYTWFPRGQKPHWNRAHGAPYYFLEGISKKGKKAGSAK